MFSLNILIVKELSTVKHFLVQAVKLNQHMSPSIVLWIVQQIVFRSGTFP